MVPNLASAFLEEKGEALHDYIGMCGELVDAIIHWLGEDRVSILYIETANPDDCIFRSPSVEMWKYHMVAVIDGMVHDAWFPDLVLPPDEYVQAAFPGQRLKAEITS